MITDDAAKVVSVEEAIDIVAAGVLSALLSEYGGEEWGNYPEIGEGDWERVIERAAQLIADPSADAFKDAYAVLEKRAQEWEAEHR